MIILNTAKCAEIASDVLGERCEVLIEVDPGALGRAWKTESGDRMISVSPFQQPGSLLDTFFHELGHHALGHVNRSRRHTKSLAEVLDGKSAEATEAIRVSHLGDEKACDDLAQSIMESLGPEAWRELLIDTEQDNT